MLNIADSDIIEQTGVILNAMHNSKVGTIAGDEFQRHSFPLLESMHPRTYPYEVRIPKSLQEMSQGDFEPARVITIEKPFKGPYSDMWFGDATKGVSLLCGYINGDNRYVCDTPLGDDAVHGIMVGATGQGKSVTLNSIIYNACTLYAPWELHLTLSDAKIVEFKSIALNNPMPHIETVAATGDVDYLYSVLLEKHAEMELVNSIFTVAAKTFGKEVKKIADFRKVTGLMLPQNLLIFDEFQAMFSNAKKLSGKIAAELDSFARLGRNAGYHLLLTSQELGTDIPKATLANIRFRGAMGCEPDVSKTILGNPNAANNLGRKGKMIINLNSAKEHNESDNINVSVPYIDPQTGEIAKVLIETGRQMGVAQHLNFYDEQKIEHPDEFKEFLAKQPINAGVLYFGEPSFLTDEPTNRLVLKFSNEENNNIMVLSAMQLDIMRHFIALKENVLRHGTPNVVLCGAHLYEEYGAHELAPQLFFEDKDYEHSQALTVARSLIYRRIMCLLTDSYIFEKGNTSADVSVIEEMFYAKIEHGSKYDTELNKLRFFVMKNLMNSDPILVNAYSNLSDEGKLNTLHATIKTFEAYGAIDSHLTKDMVPQLTVWMLGFDKLLGFGIMQKSNNMKDFKQMLIDCGSANIRFFMFGTSFAEFTDLRELMHWYILDHPVPTDITKINKDDNYPERVSGPLAVVYDIKDKQFGCKKFKKLFFDGELPIS